MSTLYYAYKVKSALLSRFGTALVNRFKSAGILSGEIGDFRFDSKVVLYFADTSLIHLGDQLFHQPLINLLRDTCQFYVALKGDTFSEFYSEQGVRPISPDEYKSISGAIIISKADLAYSVSALFPNGNLFAGFNYPDFEQDERINIQLTQRFCDVLNHWEIPHPPLPARSSSLFDPFLPKSSIESYEANHVFEELTAEPAEQWYVFNDFVNSGFLHAARRRELLHGIARERKAAGNKIVYIGTEADKKHSPNVPDFVSLDLRGAIKPIGLYKLFSLPNVIGTISYDTFIMHIASVFQKDLYIVARRENARETIRKRYVPMFPGAERALKLYL